MNRLCPHGKLKRECETCAAWDSAVHNQKRAEKAERERDEAVAALKRNGLSWVVEKIRDGGA